jgi:hypothetical protein
VVVRRLRRTPFGFLLSDHVAQVVLVQLGSVETDDRGGVRRTLTAALAP